MVAAVRHTCVAGATAGVIYGSSYSTVRGGSSSIRVHY